MFRLLVLAVIVTAGVVVTRAADQGKRTVIYDGIATEVSVAPESSSDLWITTDDLTRATRFVIKPEGVCRDELCFPLPRNRKAEFVSKIGVVLEESDETVFWLELLCESGILKPELLQELLREANELTAIFSAAQQTAKSHIRR